MVIEINFDSFLELNFEHNLPWNFQVTLLMILWQHG